MLICVRGLKGSTMDKILLKTEKREAKGKSASKQLRKQDIIPAVVYKHGEETMSIQIKETDLIHALHTSAGENAILTLDIKGGKDQKTVIIKEMQYHPIKENILHVDFQEISLTEKITVNVPIMLKGESVGVKTEGGVLDQMLKELEIECLPTQIPEKIDVHIEEMKIGDTIHVNELDVPAEIEVITDHEQAVVSVEAPHEEPEAEEGEEGLEGEAQEPEVITEKEAEKRQAATEAGKAEKVKEEDKKE